MAGVGMGEYFASQQTAPAPGSTKEGIFNGALSGARGGGTGEYWQDGGMPAAPATREGIFNGALRGFRGAGQTETTKPSLLKPGLVSLGLGAATGAAIGAAARDPKYTKGQMAFGGALVGAVIFGVPLLIAYSLGRSHGEKGQAA